MTNSNKRLGIGTPKEEKWKRGSNERNDEKNLHKIKDKRLIKKVNSETGKNVKQEIKENPRPMHTR